MFKLSHAATPHKARKRVRSNAAPALARVSAKGVALFGSNKDKR
jgi:hypothetical protein